MSTVTVTPKVVPLPGGRFAYTERRAATSEPEQTFFFIHGLGGTLDVFYPVYGYLLAAFPKAALLSFTWPGNVDDTPITLSGIVTETDAILESEVPSGPITVIAHSAGTVLATSFLTSESPVLSRVSHAVLIGGPLNLPFPDEVVAKQEGLASLIAKDGQHGLIDAMLPLLAGKTTMESRPLAAALLRAVAMGLSKDSYAASIKAFAAAGKAPAKYDFSKIPEHTKIFVIGGAEDLMLPPGALKAVVQEIKTAKHVIMENVGHSPNVETPKETADLIISFLKE